MQPPRPVTEGQLTRPFYVCVPGLRTVAVEALRTSVVATYPSAAVAMATAAGDELRALQLDAYTKVVRCFMQGAYDLGKEEALATLRQVLHISNEDHMRVRMAVREEQMQQQQQAAAKEAVAPQGLYRPSSSPPPSPSFVLSSNPAAPAGGRQQAARGGRAVAANATAVAPQRKRLKSQGGVGGAGKPARQRNQQAGTDLGVDINPLVGRKVMRYWPRDGGWFDGIISDYNATTGEFCIVYDFGLASESYEWYSIEGSNPSEFQLVEGPVDVSRLPGMPVKQPLSAPAAAAAGAGGTTQAAQRLAHAPAAVRQQQSGRGRGVVGGAAQAWGLQQTQMAAAHYRPPAPGQRVPATVTRSRLERDWGSEEEDGEEDASGGSDVEWGPQQGNDVYYDVSD